MRILLVDADSQMSALIEFAVRYAGHMSYLAEELAAALLVVAQEAPDLVPHLVNRFCFFQLPPPPQRGTRRAHADHVCRLSSARPVRPCVGGCPRGWFGNDAR